MAECTGTAASYARGCTCERCYAADKARRLKRLRNGSPPYRRAHETHQRILELMAAGLSKRQVCEQSGVDYYTVTRILSGEPPRRVLDRTMRAIFAVEPQIPAWAYVDASPTIRLVTRLHDQQGYSYGFIADSCGIGSEAVRHVKKHRYCRRYVADAITEFAEFAGRSPGVARDRRRNGRRALSNDERIALKEAS